MLRLTTEVEYSLRASPTGTGLKLSTPLASNSERPAIRVFNLVAAVTAIDTFLASIPVIDSLNATSIPPRSAKTPSYSKSDIPSKDISSTAIARSFTPFATPIARFILSVEKSLRDSANSDIEDPKDLTPSAKPVRSCLPSNHAIMSLVPSNDACSLFKSSAAVTRFSNAVRLRETSAPFSSFKPEKAFVKEVMKPLQFVPNLLRASWVNVFAMKSLNDCILVISFWNSLSLPASVMIVANPLTLRSTSAPFSSFNAEKPVTISWIKLLQSAPKLAID